MATRRLSLPLLGLVAVTALSSSKGRRDLLHPGAHLRVVSKDGSGETLPPEARQPGRGREATAPWQIPWRGWKDIFIRAYASMNDDRLLAVAGGLVFFVLLAIFPTIAALVSLYALFADPKTIAEHLSALGSFMPPDSLKLLTDEVTRIASKSNGALGVTSIVALLFALWSANSGTKAIFDGLNVAYDVKEKRSFIRLNLIAIGFTIGAIVFLLLSPPLLS